jgi:hypothetical protein
MNKIIFSAVLTIGILVAIDHYFYFDRYTEALMSFLYDIRRSFAR